jgi:Protein of unknown function (DUF3500)
MPDAALIQDMIEVARKLLTTLEEDQLALAALPFRDDTARRWLEYRPHPRPGASLSGMGPQARKAAHRLLATGLSPHAYAQAMAIVALEEVLDRQEGWRRGRHSNDYWVAVFGDPGRDDRWSWRFEGHHVSVTMTIVDGTVSPAPVFLGANPHRVLYGGSPVLQPLSLEEDLARVLLAAMTPRERSAAIASDEAPDDIRSGTSASAGEPRRPLGVHSGQMGTSAREVMERLVRLYLDRLPPELAAREAERIDGVHFAWEGPTVPGGRHYYRIQGEDLLIEYDNTSDDGNHAHTVLRRPRGDFGQDVLAAHREQSR